MLTVADTEGFLEAGGIVNFVTEESNIRFEINTAAAKRAKLAIRSKLLRLANTHHQEGQDRQEVEPSLAAKLALF